MFKRTNSYLLLTMLVLTGFAGKIHSDTLTGKERRQLVQELRSSKGTLSESIEGLSDKQFEFVSKQHGFSIRQCILHLASLEHRLWSKSKKLMEQPATSFVKVNSCDEEISILSAMLEANHHPAPQQVSASHADINKALKQFRNDRQSMVRYIRTTTNNLHNYQVEANNSQFDIYHLLTLNAKYTEACARIIDDIKRSPGFPK
jgi:chromosome segregation ATPase